MNNRTILPNKERDMHKRLLNQHPILLSPGDFCDLKELRDRIF